MKVVSSEQMKKIEQAAMNELGIPSIILMENAAIAVVNECRKQLEGIKKPKAVIIAGKGNNGGDGLAVARHLHLLGIDTGVIFTGEPESATLDCQLNLNIIQHMDIPITFVPDDDILNIPYTIETCDIVIDALIGTGLKDKLNDIYEYLVDIVNRCARYVISIDCPTGINSDTGLVPSTAIKADKTVTFFLPKLGLLLHPASEYAGEIITADISIPYDLASEFELEYNTLTKNEIADFLPNRNEHTHKGNYGRAFLFAGSTQMPGAAVLASSAAYKIGCGLLNACVTADVSNVIHSLLPEAITTILPAIDGKLCAESYNQIKEKLNDATIVALGSGMGQSAEASEFVFKLVENSKVPLIIDADAINAIAKNTEILKKIKVPCVITPHMVEMSRLTGKSVEYVAANVIKTAREFAHEYNIITVLKDSRTVIAHPDGEIYINTTGCNAMAKAGSGDCLTGSILGLACQGKDLYTASVLASYINGKAAELAASNLSNYGVLARDVINSIPLVLNHAKPNSN